ncbi:MAG: penicillin-binding protein 2 [Gammaproteobacteria bacterium]|nr:penicillin-binding protein 2 [Gammaproteobacteria bacterium]MBU1654203.1 penicillin-binding protein 2 [Gammaproteobacteria bacterium]MBU1960863.1 penicillin-binding protein 2 [Gammaproteobacteria bacterium]
MKKATKRQKKTDQATRRLLPNYRLRRQSLQSLLLLIGLALVAGTVDRQIFETEFLQREGEKRHLRVVEVPVGRGVIKDRNGEPLAVSTPVESVWADPRELKRDKGTLNALAKALQMDLSELKGLLPKNDDRTFVYLKRRIDPAMADAARSLNLDGVHLDREFRRFYPAGEVAAHVLGFTDVEDHGQEGLERTLEQSLSGEAGKKRVIRDGLRRIVSDVENIKLPRPGREVTLSLDLRLQFLAYRELKLAVEEHKAIGGTAVIIDARSGEVLAMVNQPAYNPNGKRTAAAVEGGLRNRAVTDLFEPGSTMKPFIVAAALESGRYRPDTPVETSPGRFHVPGKTIEDIHNYGLLDVAGVIRKSSNVGASKIALSFPKKELWEYLDRMGFGKPMESGFPGERQGQLLPYQRWYPVDQAVVAYGYGVSVTALQLARAYAAIAADGVLPVLSFTPREAAVPGVPVMSAKTAQELRVMLESVVSVEGTAQEAAVPGYRIGGKTGTARKLGNGNYAEKNYLALFVGMAPMSDPRLVMAIMIDEPSGKKYYGGLVAAPVFAKVMAGALRLLNVAPDGELPKATPMVAAGGVP